MSTSEPSDAAALVAEIEAEVARKRAAGEYPTALLESLQAEFRGSDLEVPLEGKALILSALPIRSARPVIGQAVVAYKKVLRRLLAWYINPITVEQSNFNTAVVREIRSLQRSLHRLETTWSHNSSSIHLPSDEQRLSVIAKRLSNHPGGTALLLGGRDEIRAALKQKFPDMLQLTGTAPEQLDKLESLSNASTGAVILLGVLPTLAAPELLDIGKTIARILRPDGIVVADAPDPTDGPLPVDPGMIDLNMRRWVSPDTATLLFEAAGLNVDPVDTIDGVKPRWFVCSAHR